MILLLLLVTIAFGTGIFVISQIVDWIKMELTSYQSLYNQPLERRCRKHIKKDLDKLIMRYKSGAIDEREFSDQTDELIDELADNIHTHSMTSY